MYAFLTIFFLCELIDFFFTLFLWFLLSIWNVRKRWRTPPHGHTQYIGNQCNFLSKLVIIALSHQEWKSMPLAKGTCCSVEQWNDSGEWVALGPALKGPVNRTGFERDTTQVQGFPASKGLKVNRGDASADMHCYLPYFLLTQIFSVFFTPDCSVCEQLQPTLVLYSSASFFFSFFFFFLI